MATSFLRRRRNFTRHFVTNNYMTNNDDLFFQSLNEEIKRDLYRSIDELKTFIDNIPNES